MGNNLQTIFTVAQTNLGKMPFNNHERTLRIVVHCNVEAESLQVLFTNQFGQAPLTIGAASAALCDKEGTIDPETLAPVTVGGLQSFVLEPGEDLLSDNANISIKPGEYVAISLYYPTEEHPVSGNWVAANARRSRPGNYTADPELPGPQLVSRAMRTVIASDMTVNITNISQVIANAERPSRVVACFGDSITQQSNWTDPFLRLLYHTYPGEISLCNLGIGGNRLLQPSPEDVGGAFGIAGIERFKKDVLSVKGLTHVIMDIGTNDIGHPGTHDVPLDMMPTLEEYIAGMESIAKMAHDAGAKVYVGTLIPREINKVFTEEREQLRIEMNEWLRAAECFDAVIDFDAVMRREDGKPGMKDECYLPDNLHPTPFGGMLMAKSIDLALFE